MKVEQSSGNVFADLGLPHAETRQRLARKFAGRKNGLKLFLAACAAISATGCTTTRYITVGCVTPEQYNRLEQSEPPKVGDQLTGRADRDIRPIAGSNVRLRSYARGLLGVLRGCVGG